MHNSENSTDAALLYRQFSEAFTAEDDDAVRRVYRKFLNFGRPRTEIVEEAVRHASNRDGIRRTVCNSKAKARTIPKFLLAWSNCPERYDQESIDARFAALRNT